MFKSSTTEEQEKFLKGIFSDQDLLGEQRH